MKRLLLSIIVLCVLVSDFASASEFKNRRYWHMEMLDDVFWCNLRCDGVSIDLNLPPPNYDETIDSNLFQRPELGYEDLWHAYFRNVCPVVTWNNISFCVTQEPPNYSDWDIEEVISAWSLYFNEMFYDGGPDYALDDEASSLFWDNLVFNNEPVDIYTAPPNYDPALDYWAEVRADIGYAWYWEYYICGEIGLTTDEVTNLAWKGITFNGHNSPPDYVYKEDPFYFSRIRRGHLDGWGKYFVTEYSADS